MLHTLSTSTSTDVRTDSPETTKKTIATTAPSPQPSLGHASLPCKDVRTERPKRNLEKSIERMPQPRPKLCAGTPRILLRAQLPRPDIPPDIRLHPDLFPNVRLLSRRDGRFLDRSDNHKITLSR